MLLRLDNSAVSYCLNKCYIKYYKLEEAEM